MKFKLAVAENERRKIQEEQALLRRKQREEQLAVKKRLCEKYTMWLHICYCIGSIFITIICFSVTNDQQMNGSDVESNLVDSLLYDIRSGFPHKKSFDKVSVVKLADNLM